MYEIFKKIPHEIVRYILLFDKKIRYRNGKYMDQIDVEDDRYYILYKIPSKLYDSIDQYTYVNLCINQDKDYMLSYYMARGKHTLKLELLKYLDHMNIIILERYEYHLK
jgi:hypothetical protein